ncbi:MAG: hypothetical protein NWF07_07895 [Candidatus Bathyarchaeota archaeon]|nr:hypothetical protein [Candidatus Bathyarchaeota archaeon]
MSTHRRIIYSVMLILVAIILFSLGSGSDEKDENLFASSGSYERVIWTEKEVYELGEEVEAAIVFINPNEYPLNIDPIYSLSFSGNSVYDPEKITCEIYLEYVEPKIIIPEKGNTTITINTFTPTYPGPFKITGLGLVKTVNVTGYKEVNVNSTGISLKIEPEVPVLKDKENVWFDLIIVNENPYPVKIRVFNEIGYCLIPSKPKGGMMVDWIMSHYTVEANSEKGVWRNQFRVTLPGFSLYYYIRGVTVSFEREVVP